MPEDTIASGATNTTANGAQANPVGEQPAGSAAPNSATQPDASKQAQEAKQTDSGKPGDQKTPDGKSNMDGTANKAPEKYDLKLPDGAKLDAKHLETVADYAKQLGLSQEQAQKLVERDASLVDSHLQGMQANHAEQVQKWADAVRNDKDLGGSNFDTTVTAARRAVDRFGDPELKQALNESGYGNHPGLVRMLAKIGKAMAEDSFVNSNKPAGKQRDAASILYGSGS